MVLDSVNPYDDQGAWSFVLRTFCQPERLGKVVCKYQ